MSEPKALELGKDFIIVNDPFMDNIQYTDPVRQAEHEKKMMEKLSGLKAE